MTETIKNIKKWWITLKVHPDKLSTYTIVLIYVIVGGVWILLSDRLLSIFVTDSEKIFRYGLLKGLFYIAITAILLYLLIERYFAKIRRLQTTLKESERHYRAIFDTLGVAAIIVAQDMTITLANLEFEQISGFSKKETEGKKKWTDLIPGEYLDKFKEYYHKVQHTNPAVAPKSFETQVIHNTGEMKSVLVTISPIPESEWTVLSLLDITDRKKAQELARIQQQQLMQADKMATLGILVSGVAHEINNPNNYILLNGKIMARVWDDIAPILENHHKKTGNFLLAGMPYSRAYEKIKKLISGIPEGAQRIQKIVNSLKDFARQDIGNLTDDVDVNAVVESAIIIAHNLIKKSTNNFTVTYGQNLPKIKGNFQQLEQVVINLVTNSCQALPGLECNLAVTTAYDPYNNCIIIKVYDEGIGITKENMRHIFDPFFTTKRDAGGTGLGLSISYNILKEHGGYLEFDSIPRKCTTAMVVLPINPLAK